MNIYEEKVFAKGCAYMVGMTGDICNKCGQAHNLTAKEAQVWPFNQDGDGDAD